MPTESVEKLSLTIPPVMVGDGIATINATSLREAILAALEEAGYSVNNVILDEGEEQESEDEGYKETKELSPDEEDDEIEENEDNLPY